MEDTKLAVIFDVDGVLVDSYRPHLASWQQVASEAGLVLTEEQFAATFGQTSQAIITRFWGTNLDAPAVRAIDERKEAIYRGMIADDFPAMAGAAELVDALFAAGFALAVASSGPPENIELTLAKLARRDRFGAVVTRADVTRGKPDPQVFQVAARRLRVAPARAAVIEDAPVGIAAANAAGMTSIALSGTVAEDQLASARLLVRSLGELSPQRIRDLILR